MSAGDIDVAGLRRRYADERTRRLRPEGVDQYVRPGAPGSAFAGYLDDPFSAPITREARIGEVEVLMTGGGFGGLMLGAQLVERGIDDFVIVDAAGDFGGTWYWNRYPGIACDVEASVYLPRLEQIGTVPTMRYAAGGEILRHCQTFAEHFDLYRRALFQTRVTAMDWDEESARWIVRTDRGDCLRARFVALSTGPLNQAKLPGVPGIGDFAGRAFHTSRWDYGYTGGNEDGELTGLSDKRVGLIGTGATAIQCVPHLAEWAHELTVFQRTPSTIQPRENRRLDPAWFAAQPPGWQAKRVENFSALVIGAAIDDPFGDGCTRTFKDLFTFDGVPDDVPAAIEANDFRVMERIRRHIADCVRDPVTAGALQPWYGLLCKRMGFSDTYLPAFNRPNVRLVDTQGRGVERIVADGVIANGELVPLDCLIFATGFEWYTEHRLGCGFELRGRGGLAQSDYWREGVLSLHGIHSRHFPNRFVIGNSQQPQTANFAHSLDIVTRHVAALIEHCRRHGFRTVEPGEDAQNAWVEGVVAFNRERAGAANACTPGYYNGEGHGSLREWRNGGSGGDVNGFDRALRAQAEAGVFDGLEFA